MNRIILYICYCEKN